MGMSRSVDDFGMSSYMSGTARCSSSSSPSQAFVDPSPNISVLPTVARCNVVLLSVIARVSVRTMACGRLCVHHVTLASKLGRHTPSLNRYRSQTPVHLHDSMQYYTPAQGNIRSEWNVRDIACELLVQMERSACSHREQPEFPAFIPTVTSGRSVRTQRHSEARMWINTIINPPSDSRAQRPHKQTSPVPAVQRAPRKATGMAT